MLFRDRIKELRRVKASDLRPNPRNWRTHPKAQQEALRGLLAEIGYADALLARECEDGSLMLVDGHLRAETTPDALVPVLVLDVTADEADKLLVTLDPLAGLAQAHAPALEALLQDVRSSSTAVTDMLAELAEANAISLPYAGEMAEPPAPPAEFPEYGEEIETKYCCPKCGYGGRAIPLPPGSRLDLRTGKLHQWYTVPVVSGAVDVLALLEQGVRRRLVADAPLCTLLSGGLDSSLILALARRHNPDVVAYTAVFDRESADLRAARCLCREWCIELREVAVMAPTADSLGRAAATIEIASKAQIEIAALCLPLAERIGRDGFKACLSGEAADELFGGYGNLCIRAAREDDAGWRRLRLEKMSRGNFVRCNKVFMAHGVECRLPFMERRLVEAVLSMGKAACPPGKKRLKAAAAGVLPPWVINRPKETFQGGSGLATAAGKAVANPVRYYNGEIRRRFGALVRS